MWRIVTGFLVGYYMGTKAGREQFEELRGAIKTIVTSETVHQAIRDGSARLDRMTDGSSLQIAKGVLARSPIAGQLAELAGGLAKKAIASGPTIAPGPKRVA